MSDVAARLARLTPEKRSRFLAQLPPLSAGQRQMWFVQQLNPASTAYNVSRVLRLLGEVETERLALAVGELARRHHTLRYVFLEHDGQPHAWIAEPESCRLQAWRPQPGLAEEATAQAERKLAEILDQPFDLRREPPLRVHLLRLGDRESLLVITVHHICCDEWSLNLIVDELKRTYRALAANRPDPPPEGMLQYADFARWQRRRQEEGHWRRGLSYWLEKFSPAPPALRLTTDHPRRPVASGAGAYATRTLEGGLVDRLAELQRRQGVTPFMLLLAAFKTLLHRYTAQNDLTVGTPVTLRSRREFESVVGYMVNTLALRTSIAGDPTFQDFLGRVRQTAVEAFAHQEVPYDLVVERLRTSGDLLRSSLFQVMFLMQEPTLPPRAASREPTKLKFRTESCLPPRSKFDLTLHAVVVRSGLRLMLNYSTDLFDGPTMERMLEHFEVLLDSIAASPEERVSRLSLLTPKERRQLLVGWNQTRRPPSGKPPIHERVAGQALQTQDRVAVLAGRDSLTYRQLMNWVHALQARLSERVPKPGAVVPILMSGGAQVPVSILATLGCGAAYAPLDPRWGQERLTQILDQIAGPVVLADPAGAQRLTGRSVIVVGEPPGGDVPVPEARPVSADSPFCVMTTSGSTGRPKCVVISHGGVENRFDWMDHFYGPEAGRTILQTTPHAYDSSVWQLLWPLTFGGKTVIPTLEEALDGKAVANLIDVHGVTMIDFVPSVLQHLLVHLIASPERPSLQSLKVVIIGGEEIIPEAVTALRDRLPEARLLNAYGPTEATIGCLVHEIGGNETARIPIGRPNDNVYAVILDGYGNLSPTGVAGELCLGGRCLALGYLGSPRQTAEAFVENRFPEIPGERLYRTGDLARHRGDGEIEFLGRIDDQIQIRGVRVEPKEVEAALRRHPALSQCAVVPRRGGDGRWQLSAFYVAPDSKPAPSDLRRFLGERLPSSFIPSHFISTERLPRLPNGKIDRKALVRFEPPDPEEGGPSRAPASVVESALLGIWRELLRRPQLSLDADFFAAGGHSLLAMQLTSRIRERLQRDVPLNAVFEHPTVGQLAKIVAGAPPFIATRPSKQPRESIQDMLEKLEGEAGLNAAKDSVTTAEPAADSATPEGPAAFPISEQQRPFWELFQLYPEKSFANIRLLSRMQGKLQPDALRQALADLMQRHELLRAGVRERSKGTQHFVAGALEPPLTFVDLSGLETSQRRQRFKDLVREEGLRPFDLGNPPLFRLTALQVTPQECALLYVFHHIIIDGWSLGTFGRELSELYQARQRGRTASLGSPAGSYSEFVSFQRHWLTGEGAQRDLDYWKAQLEGAEPLDLPTDFPGSERIGFRSARLWTVVPPSQFEQIQGTAQRESCTVFMVLAAALTGWLHRLTGQTDILISTLMANRTRSGFEGVVGLFANQGVLRSDLSENPSPRQLLRHVRAAALDAFLHQTTPFPWISRQLGVDGRLGPGNVMLVHQNWNEEDLALKHAVRPDNRPTISDRPVVQATADALDLAFAVSEGAKTLEVRVEYNPDRFTKESVLKWLEELNLFLVRLCEDQDYRLQDQQPGG